MAIPAYDFENLKEFVDRISRSYQEAITEVLPFEMWKTLALPNLFKNPSRFKVTPVEYGKSIRICHSGVDCLKMLEPYISELQEIKLNTEPLKQESVIQARIREILQPKQVITIDEPITIPGELDGDKLNVPIWFNTSKKEIVLRFGFSNLDSSKPSVLALGDDIVCAFLAGRTGMGKSVALHDVILTALLEYPPWEVEFYLADFKIVELTKYGNFVPTPHVKVIAATESTEYVLSVMDALVEEMNARKAIFALAGVENLKSFRNVFNMVMPRIVLIADEFVQMKQNIIIARNRGDDFADEMGARIDGRIGEVARLGRSHGVHQLLSSQNLEGALDEQTSAQFDSGACLGANAPISNMILGNDAASKLKTKGRIIVNQNKSLKDPRTNVLVRVPLIQTELSKEDLAAGKISYLQETLSELYNAAKQLGFENYPEVYNERVPIPISLYEKHIAFALDKFNNPQEGSDTLNAVYREQIFAVIPLGPKLAYKTALTEVIEFKRIPRSNLIIHAVDMLHKVYMCKLIARGFSKYLGQHSVVVRDQELFERTELTNFLPTASISYSEEFPQDFFKLLDNRTRLLSLQSELSSTWNDVEAWSFYTSYVLRQFPRADSEMIRQYPELVSWNKEQISDVAETLRALELKVDDVTLKALVSIVTYWIQDGRAYHSLNGGQAITASLFAPKVLWIFGIDQLKDIENFEVSSRIATALSKCCQCNMFVIVIGERWTKISRLAEQFSFIIENANKEFFLDVGLPKRININANSFQVHKLPNTPDIIQKFQ